MGSSAYSEAPKTATPEKIDIGVQVDGRTIGTINVASIAVLAVAEGVARDAYPAIPEGATPDYTAGKLINFTTAPATETPAV